MLNPKTVVDNLEVTERLAREYAAERDAALADVARLEGMLDALTGLYETAVAERDELVEALTAIRLEVGTSTLAWKITNNALAKHTEAKDD